jgi:putative ABC transport system permease protein
MALLPLVRVSRTTVRSAMDHHGGGPVSAATGILARLGRIDRLDRGLLMALRNTLRRPARFALSVTLLGLAGMVFVAGLSLNAGTKAIDEERKAQRTWDVEVALARPAAAAAVTGLVRAVPGVTRAEGWNRSRPASPAPDGYRSPGRTPTRATAAYRSPRSRTARPCSPRRGSSRAAG